MSRFIESFDSVRYTPENRDVQRKIHAEVELLISLLFGRNIVIPEPYSFDSLSFLEIAYKVISARDAIADRIEPERKRQCPVWDPFTLALRPNHKTYREAVSDLIGNPNFILSSLPEITENEKARTKLAQFIGQEDYLGASKHVKQFSKEREGNIDWLEKLDRYFSGHNCIEAEDDTQLLPKVIRWIKNVDTGNIDRELFPLAVELRKALNELEISGIDLTNRGDVRNKGQKVIGDKVFNEVLEYIDGCYNRVISHLVKAEYGVFSTTGSGKEKSIQQAEELSENAANSNELNYTFFGTMKDKNIEDEEMQDRLSNLIIISWEDLWKEILTDNDWIQSVRRLPDDTYSSRLSVAEKDIWNEHIELLAKRLSQLSWELAIKEKGKQLYFKRMILRGSGMLCGKIIGLIIQQPISEPLLQLALGEIAERSPDMIGRAHIKGSIEKCLRRNI